MADDADRQQEAENRKYLIEMKKQAVKIVNSKKSEDVVLQDIQTQSSPEKNKRSSPGAEIIVKDDEVLLEWNRKLAHDKKRNYHVLYLPKAIKGFDGLVTITYNPRANTLLIKAVEASG